MGKNNDPKAIASLLKGLSMLENYVSLLYKTLGDKVGSSPLVQSLLLSIASDSQKHSTVLKGVGESIAKSEAKPKECEEKLSEVWHVTDNFYKEIAAKERITEEELPQLAEKLTVLESMLGEEYYVFVQLKTLEFMTKEISQLYNINLGNLESIFVGIINDEEHHRELLGTIKELLNREEPKKADNAPVVKYQNPDFWINPSPPTS